MASSAYGVQTSNIFDLLGEESPEDDAPQEVITPVKPKPTLKASKPAEKPAAKAPSTPAERSSPNGPAVNGRGSPGARGRNGVGRGGFGGRGVGRGMQDREGPPRIRESPAEGEGYGGEGRRGPRGEGRGRGRGRGGFRGDGDRHSRNGFSDGAGLKRDGQGKGNWGSDKDTIKVAEEGEDGKPEEAVEEEAPQDIPAEGITPVKEDEGEKEMTLDEYEKVLEEKRVALNKAAKTPTYKVDAAKEFQGMKVVEKRDVEAEDNTFELTNKKTIGARKAGLVEKERKEKAVIEANFRFADESRGRGRGRGRGLGRGRFDSDDRPRRDRDTPPARQAVPRNLVITEGAFPALAPKQVTIAN
eukprot:jgi/Botrbrau1/22578/Bobra.176_1s0011.2